MGLDDRKLTRRTQFFLTDDQYRWLKIKAGSEGSVAAVVRAWIDSEIEPGPDLRDDPAIRYLLEAPPSTSGVPSSAQTIAQEIYG